MIYLPKGPTMTEEQAIRWLVDESYKASKQMIRTHHKEDIVRFIVLAQTLEQHGYHMVWVKFKGCVGATKTLHAVNTIMTKEVQKYANPEANHGSVDGSISRNSTLSQSNA